MRKIEGKATFNVPRGREPGSAVILVVEDDRALLKLIERRLRQCGFQTRGVTSGSSALSWLEENSPRLMLMDYSLPDMFGEELLAQLPSHRREVPFVVATGHTSETVTLAMMNRGARDCLIKDSMFLRVLPVTLRKVLSQLAEEEFPEERDGRLDDDADGPQGQVA